MMRKGFVLNGRYQIIKRLGEGGMADVYLAKDLILGRLVAVKVLRLDFRDDKKAQERFRHEAMAATALDNPHIVGIYDVDEMDGMQYIAMEYIDGEDLKYYIKNHFPIPYAQVIDILEQILSAVHEAHRHNIIHRDLKPQNVLIDKNGYAKITDFGISKAESENTMTQTRSIVGSIHYLSPEQIKGQVANQQSDIYSLGIILYEMLTGKVPFNGETAVSIAIKHSQTPIPSVRDFDPRIPQALENVVLKATTKDPRNRYDTVAQMADDLRTSLDQSRANEAKFTSELDDDAEQTRVMPFAPLRPELVEAAARANDESAKDDVKDTENRNVSPKKKPGKYKRKVALTILVVILVLSGLTMVLLARIGSKASVPNLTNLTRQTAIKRLAQNDLAVGKITYEANDEVEKNNVVKTNPQAGRLVRKKTKVNLTVSSGPKLIKLENYVGQDYKVIANKLSILGFTVKRRNASSSTFKAGKILQQDFKPGQKAVPKNKVITFIVSTGVKQITLENLTGMSKEQVISYMNEQGINPVFDYVYSNIQDKGKVVKQSPGAGQTIQQGSSVVVYLSRGKQKTKKAITSFNVRIKIPFEDATTTGQNKTTNTAYSQRKANPSLAVSSDSVSSDANSSSEISSSSSDENSTADADSSPTKPTENIVLIYLKDHDHTFASVYKQMVITKDTNVILPFKLGDNEVGKYKVIRNGKVILRENNVTADSN